MHDFKFSLHSVSIIDFDILVVKTIANKNPSLNTTSLMCK